MVNNIFVSFYAGRSSNGAKLTAEKIGDPIKNEGIRPEGSIDYSI
jgi:hypothetical protein